MRRLALLAYGAATAAYGVLVALALLVPVSRSTAPIGDEQGTTYVVPWIYGAPDAARLALALGALALVAAGLALLLAAAYAAGRAGREYVAA